MIDASVRLPNFAAPRVAVEHRTDGSFVLRSPQALNTPARCLSAFLEHHATVSPDQPFLSERSAEGNWVSLGYEDVFQKTRSVAAALLRLGLGPDRPIAIVSGNSINHAILSFAAMHVGIPVAPISVAYSLMSSDFSKLKSIIEVLRPGLIFAEQFDRFSNAVDACAVGDAILVTTDGAAIEGWQDFEVLLSEAADLESVDRVAATVGPDTVAKILFTSGSTGMPKGVVNTQRMLCSNQEMIAHCWPFVEEERPVLVDWLPWNHTFGGNHNMNLILRNGGTLFIDQGKPMPGVIETTVANLKSVSPTMLFNVPRGFDMLLPYLESDGDLRESLFRRLKIIFNAGAALPESISSRLNTLMDDHLGHRLPIIGAWGATETAPMVTCVHFPGAGALNIGLPAPGAELLMIPNGEKLEMRVRGPNVTPGYWRSNEVTRDAFDQDGFYKIGDAGRLADPDDPAKGVEFDGRVAENFKLISGTWVHVGALRLKVIEAFAPLVQDAVIVGENQNTIGLLIFPNIAACAKIAELDLQTATPLEIIEDGKVRLEFRERLKAFASRAKGGSERPSALTLLEEPPQIDANEITDKGYINQRAVMDRRGAHVDGLYANPPSADVISVD